ncbi:hypothetical protein [Arthrobacter sp. NA-172]|uniref:hypothetical protein n=1 Tax=Arthrobacter sp. NA-172 TaxID=3367524 RepID=UPI003754F965
MSIRAKIFHATFHEGQLPDGRPQFLTGIAWLPHIKKDVKRASMHWTGIAAFAPADGPKMTPLRALDMVAPRLVEEKDLRKRGRVRRRIA